MDPFVKADEEKRLRNTNVERFDNLLAEATVIAENNLFKAQGMNAVYVLFAYKLKWTPAQVRSMTLDEIIIIFDNLIKQ